MNFNLFKKNTEESISKFSIKNHLSKLGKLKNKKEMQYFARTEKAYLSSELIQILNKYHDKIDKRQLMKELELI